MKHIHARVQRKSGLGSIYDVDIFQCAYDEICISLSNIFYFQPSYVQFDIPVKKAEGFRIKINSSSVGNDTGSAADLIDFLSGDIGKEFISGMVNKVIFQHSKRGKTAGL